MDHVFPSMLWDSPGQTLERSLSRQVKGRGLELVVPSRSGPLVRESPGHMSAALPLLLQLLLRLVLRRDKLGVAMSG